MPLANAELDGMINVRTNDSEVYTVFASDLVDASASAPVDEDNPLSTDYGERTGRVPPPQTR